MYARIPVRIAKIKIIIQFTNAQAAIVIDLVYQIGSRQDLSRESIAARGLEREGPTSVAQWEGERSDYSH